MASLVTYSNGLRRIEFQLEPKGERKLLRLGRMTARAAQTVLRHVEAVIGDKLAGRAHDADVSAWLGKLDESMLKRLRGVGLADGVGLSRTTLGEFLAKYFETMGGKVSTRLFYSHTRRNLETYFDPTHPLRSITEADADGWRAWLVEHEKLASATVARRVIAARTIWRKAIRWKLAVVNPFDGVAGGQQSNESRKQFISHDDIAKVVDACPDCEWRAIVALARYGGLRTPSETFALRWGDIDWDRGTIHVRCPKLEHNEKFASRTLPLFPELRKPLLDLFEEAEPGTEYVISRNRLACGNIGPQFARIVRRAGLTPWPRLFHNLRASRETELMREYDLATVCRWIGNSPAIAARHYATSIDLDSDFRRAAGLDPEGKAQQKAQQKAQEQLTAKAMQEQTSEGVENEKALETQGIGESWRDRSNHAEMGEWAILDLNQ